MKILALDLGKSKTVACHFDTEGGKEKYQTIATEPSEMAGLLERSGADRVVMEVGPIAGWVCDLAWARSLEVQVANPSTEGWRWRNVKKKTDKVDALKLARLSAMDQLPQVHMPPPRVRQWRSLIGYRSKLVDRRTAVKNSLRDILLRQGVKLDAGKKGWTEENRQLLRSLAKPWEEVEGQELWRGELTSELKLLEELEGLIEKAEDKLDALGQEDPRVKLLKTIPGVGARTSEALVTAFDEENRFQNRRQVGSYGGMVPRQRQSGSTDRNGRITKAGSRVLRKLLVEASWAGLRWNPWMLEIFRRVSHGSKNRRKIAIVAVARRVMIWAWAILRDRQPWRPPWAIRAPASQAPKSPKVEMKEFLEPAGR